MLRRFLLFSLSVITPVFLFVVAVVPNRISEIEPQAFLGFPLELIIVALALLVRGKTGLVLQVIAAILLAAGTIFKLADMAAFQIFARPFNPVFDAYLLADGMNLLNGAVGKLRALGVALVLALAVLVIIFLAFLALRPMRTTVQARPRQAGIFLGMALLLWFSLAASGWPRATTVFYDQLAQHARDVHASLVDIKAFRAVVDDNPYAGVLPQQLFSKLRGKDILLVFLESYGRTVLDRPEFAAHIRPVLEQGSAALAASGISARSAYITSPTVGGISWLAHGTTLSGLWINSQVRYDSLLMSQRPSLNRLFQQAGWSTAAVEPAITMAWPDAAYFGYDRTYPARKLGYQGKPFNWITMPDQFTLSAFENLERKPGHAPVMTEMALISSHAPWTPVPELLDWSALGDGSVFNTQAQAGDPPDVVWRDNNRVREQYRKSIEYVLATLVSYAVHYGDDDLVILALGDHQPAPLVTGENASRDVIVHLIARDPAVMDAVADWHWTDGMLPATDAPVWRMDEIRERLIRAFSQ